jgi:hypothetical protein
MILKWAVRSCFLDHVEGDMPPMFIPLALGVLSPSVSASAPAPAAAPEADPFVGEKNSGDCVEVACRREFLGVACGPRCEAWEASLCSCSSGPPGAGLLEGI